MPGGSVAAEALSIGELKRMAIFHIAMTDPTGKQIAVTGKAFSMSITRQLASTKYNTGSPAASSIG